MGPVSALASASRLSIAAFSASWSAKAVSEMKINEIAPMYAYGHHLDNSLSISAKVANCKSCGSGIDTIKATPHKAHKLGIKHD